VNPSAHRVILASNGAYPRSGDSSEEQILRTTNEAFHRGERTIADLLDAENVLTKFLIHEQVRAGVEWLTDGCGRWADPISHVAGKFEGITLGERRALPGTKIFYRVPRITGKLSRKTEHPRTLADEYRFGRNALGLLPTSPQRAGKLSLKPVLVGPYTLARYSESDLLGFGSVEARAEAFSELIAHEIAPLAAAGASLIQIDEPAILDHPDEWEIFARVFGHIAAVRNAAAKGARPIELALHVYGGGQVKLLENLFKLSADVIGLDFASDPQLLAAARAIAGNRAIGAGLVSGQAAALEEEAALHKTFSELAAHTKIAYLGAASGMESLPGAAAFAKFQVLASLSRG